jgi:hypothetical protein
MSKLDIGVGEEFPLDEGAPEQDRHAWKDEYRAMRRARRRHRHHHGHHHHRHHYGRRGLFHLPLFLGVAAVAGLIGAGKIAAPATHMILALAGVAIVLAGIAHFIHHRRWHGHAQ